MNVHTRYLQTRDGIFRVLVEGQRPSLTSAERYNSTMTAIGILSEHLSSNYRLYADGVNRLCMPDGIAECRSMPIEEVEADDDILIGEHNGDGLPIVCYYAKTVA